MANKVGTFAYENRPAAKLLTKTIDDNGGRNRPREHTIGSAPPPHKRSHYLEASESLCAALEGLEQSISLLGDRLYIVTRPSPTESGMAPDGDELANSPLVNWVYGVEARIKRAAEKLDIIRGDLEI